MLLKILVPFIVLGVIIVLALLYFNHRDKQTPKQKFCDKHIYNVNDYPKIDDIESVY